MVWRGVLWRWSGRGAVGGPRGVCQPHGPVQDGVFKVLGPVVGVFGRLRSGLDHLVYLGVLANASLQLPQLVGVDGRGHVAEHKGREPNAPEHGIERADFPLAACQPHHRQAGRDAHERFRHRGRFVGSFEEVVQLHTLIRT